MPSNPPLLVRQDGLSQLVSAHLRTKPTIVGSLSFSSVPQRETTAQRLAGTSPPFGPTTKVLLICFFAVHSILGVDVGPIQFPTPLSKLPFASAITRPSESQPIQSARNPGERLLMRKPA